MASSLEHSQAYLIGRYQKKKTECVIVGACQSSPLFPGASRHGRLHCLRACVGASSLEHWQADLHQKQQQKKRKHLIVGACQSSAPFVSWDIDIHTRRQLQLRDLESHVCMHVSPCPKHQCSTDS